MTSTGRSAGGALLVSLIACFCVVSVRASAQGAPGSPTGLVKEASAGLAVQAFEQVMIGQVIPLGASGHLKISYYQSCLLETIDGGTVTIGSFSSRVDGGRIATTQDTKGCHTAQVATTASTAESGATIERVMAFDPRDWTEAVVSTAHPTFQPISNIAGPIQVRVLMLDDPAPKLIWQGKLKSLPAAYPSSAPALAVGLPYKVEMQGVDGATHSTTFSIDPGFRTVADAPANSLLVGP